MSWMLVLGLAMVALIALLHAADVRQQGRVRACMEGLQTGRGRDTLDEFDLIVRENQQILGNHHARARESRARGRYAEAARRMARGCRAIEALAPDFLSALRSLRVLARLVSVMVEVEPVRPGAFRSGGLRGLAGAGALVHEFLFTGRQRIRLRLVVVGSAFRLALRWLGGATRRAAATPAAEQHWRRIDALVSDLGRAGDESLVTARSIVQALDAVSLGHTAAARSVEL